MNKIRVVVIGAGDRGNKYAKIAKEMRNVEIIGVCELNKIRRNKFVQQYNIKSNFIFNSYSDFFKEKREVDAVFICTQDKDHLKPLLKAKEYNYNILVEKPIINNIRDYKKINNLFNNYKPKITVAHVLRHTDFFNKLKAFISKNEIGKVQSISLFEDIGYYHFTHSYVRGNWNNSKNSSPIILAKSCHDLDIINFLTDSRPLNIYSQGELNYFKKDNLPKGASDKCISCKLKESCVYSASSFYNNNPKWLEKTTIKNYNNIKEFLEESEYGKCVYLSENNVCDTQIVNMKYENNILVQFMLTAFSKEITRQIRIFGSDGEIYGDFNSNTIKIMKFREKEEIIKGKIESGHGGGDRKLIESFINSINNNGLLPEFQEILFSHLIAFKAEESRIKNKIINLN